MKSRPLIQWLKKKGEEFLPTYVNYMEGQDSNTYYKHEVDVKNFKKELDSKINPLEAIIEIDPNTRQNLFHYLLGGKVYFFNYLIRDEYGILESDWKRAHDEISIEINPNASVDVTQANHKKMIARKITKKIKVLIVEQVAAILNTMLSVFSNNPNDTEKLFHALAHQDKKKNTPLHYAFKLNLVQSCDALLQRIFSMPMECKRELVEMEDASGKTIVHYAASYASGGQFEEFQTIFGKDNIRHAFNIMDNENNTLLHAVCSSPHSKERKIKVDALCLLLKTFPKETVTEGQKLNLISTETAFLKNSAGKNPLHVASEVNSKESKYDADVINSLKQALGEKYFLKLIEQDKLGNTPLHYAIKSGNAERVKELLINIEDGIKEQLLLITNNQQETALHCALQSGNPQILKIIMNFLGHNKLHELHCTAGIVKLVAKSKVKEEYLNHINTKNAAYELVKYFLDQPKRFSDKKDDDYVKRIEDAKNCFAAIESKQELPLEDSSFFPRKRLYGLFGTSSARYHLLRRPLKKVSFSDLMECKDYFRYECKLTPVQQEIVNGLFNIAENNYEYIKEKVVEKEASQPVLAPISLVTEPSAPVEIESEPELSQVYPILEPHSPLISEVGMFSPKSVIEEVEEPQRKVSVKTKKVALVC